MNASVLITSGCLHLKKVNSRPLSVQLIKFSIVKFSSFPIVRSHHSANCATTIAFNHVYVTWWISGTMSMWLVKMFFMFRFKSTHFSFLLTGLIGSYQIKLTKLIRKIEAKITWTWDDESLWKRLIIDWSDSCCKTSK